MRFFLCSKLECHLVESDWINEVLTLELHVITHTLYLERRDCSRSSKLDTFGSIL
ncbi:hypothetical protein SCHPADRAFT_911402 [Schizopora paradoxa]|uniref:Uncharacterized protein n=1 Tax=Schizopora paradoxa TaxID=27342 RepID=A0A0H2QY05_9AGAM|nr:hypothetical protein SCHPADRAFT_911656 [Schizopora paradoxa]KLO04845.1 hypothetical protein SCHPADRAFT_911402 [Schizopora paradoxa]